MISIEAHRTAIGRFSGKARYHSRTIACKSGCIDLMCFMIILMLLELLIYGAFVMTLFFLFNYIIAFLMLTLSYGYSYLVIKHGTGILCTMMRTLAKTELTRMDSSSPPNGIPNGFPNGIKDQPLIPCSYLSTFVFDGRGKHLNTNRMWYNSCNLEKFLNTNCTSYNYCKLDGGDGKCHHGDYNLYYRLLGHEMMGHEMMEMYDIDHNISIPAIYDTEYYHYGDRRILVKCGPILDLFKTVKECTQKLLHIICITVICCSCINICINVCSRMISATYFNSCKLNLELYSLNHLKLIQLLIDGDVESNPGPVNYTETPKGKGRPKKTKRGYNFGKPRVLNFNSSINDNRFKNQSNLIHLKDIQPWGSMSQPTLIKSQFSPRPDLNCKVSVIQADIVNIKIDAIVNAANEKLLGGHGIDGIIHAKAGPNLKEKCKDFPILNASGHRCHTGQCKVTDTKGCPKLNCDYVFHTVGPRVENEKLMDTYKGLLRDCYENCLLNVLANPVKSIVFPCISTGIFKFPNEEAAHVALKGVRSWLETYHTQIEQIVFCTYEDEDFKIYQRLTSEYFPISDKPSLTTDNMEWKNDNPSTQSSKSDVNLEAKKTKCDIGEVEKYDPDSSDKDGILPDKRYSPSDNVCNDENVGISSSTDVMTTNYSDCSGTINRRQPVKLENYRVNVCFFNSIIQVLYSFPSFHDYLAQTSVSNTVIEAFRDLFEAMNSANGVVTTFPYVNQLQLPNYNLGMQYDVAEALRFMIENCYPDYSESIFGVTIDESFECEERLGGCKRKYNKPENHRILKLQIRETSDVQTVQHLLESNIDYHIPEDYKCELT